MDARLPAGPGGSGAEGPLGGATQRASRPAGARSVDAGLERRLAALETRLDDLDEAIREVLPAAIRQMVEAACREAVENEMEQVTENLRRSVSELGRLLLRDLDRLTKLLAEHRDTIVERLTEPPLPGPSNAPADSDTTAPVDDLDDDESDDEQAFNSDGSAPEDASAALVGEEGRWRVLPGRRRRRR